MIVQQGDVIIESVDNIPTEAKKGNMKNGNIILAEGETTGHAHRILDVSSVIFKEGADGLIFIQNKKETLVTHEEHKTVVIPPGTWKIRKVREYDHFAEEARNVAD